jgi:anti-sigma28 factor (negative regulator of flagellin synthesis)
MRISRPDAKSSAGINPAARVRTSGANGSSQNVEAQQSNTDQVALSNLSNYLASAYSGSPEHLARVTELGDAVSSLQYQVDSFAVSGSIIQHSIEFGQPAFLAVSP